MAEICGSLAGGEGVPVTREQHLQRAKGRALEHAARGDTANSIASLRSDLNEHPGTAGHDGIMDMAMLAMNGYLNSPAELRDFIEGLS